MAGSRSADAESGARGEVDGPETGRSRLPDFARRAERAFQDNVDRLRVRSREAASGAGEQLETARRYAIERVQERPFTTTVAALGAGILIGLLFAGRRR
jgi:ElaB/YqjD/DUF883 family membrane-anchored ribosome-binding protein